MCVTLSGLRAAEHLGPNQDKKTEVARRSHGIVQEERKKADRRGVASEEKNKAHLQ